MPIPASYCFCANAIFFPPHAQVFYVRLGTYESAQEQPGLISHKIQREEKSP